MGRARTSARLSQLWLCRPAWSTLTATAMRLAAAAVIGAAHGRGAEIVEADRDAGMGVGGADARWPGRSRPSRVSARTPRSRRGRRPSAACRRCGRNARTRSGWARRPTRAQAEKMCAKSWQTPRFSLKASLADGADVGCAGLEGQVIGDLHQQRVQEVERVAAGFLEQLPRQIDHLVAGFGQRRRAQEEASAETARRFPSARRRCPGSRPCPRHAR